MKVRKIAALAVGAAMIGATMGFATAQPTVPNIPKEFFVKAGEPNVKIVIGSQAAAADVASAADIAVALGSLLYTEKEAEASGVSVVIKEDVTHYPSPIKIYSNYFADYYKGVYNASDIEDAYSKGLTIASGYSTLPGDAWWNGSAYNGTYDDWAKWLQDYIWEDTAKNMDSITEYVPSIDYTIDDKIIDWHLKVSGIQLIGIDSSKNDNGQVIPPTSISSIKIPAGGMNVTLNFEIYNNTYSYRYADDTFGIPSSYSTWWLDDTGGSNVVTLGLTAGAEFTLFGNTYKVLTVGNGTFSYGNSYPEVWFKLNQVQEFNGYKVKAVDISVSSTQAKALFEVTAPDGRSDLVILTQNTETDVFGDGGIILTLKDTFIGIDGTLIAQVDVVTNKVDVTNGSKDTLAKGWTTYVDTVQDASGTWYIKSISLVNSNDLEGKTIDLLGLYEVSYKFESESTTYDYDGDGVAESIYVAKAYIDFEPVKKVYDYKELKVGDTVYDEDGNAWTIDQIKAGTYTEVTVMHPTEPITYLDTEIDLATVDSNLILVGGPVVNAVTAALADDLGIPKDYDGWKEKYGTGKDSGVVIYKEKLDKINGYGVVLVAGTDREGTREAAKALMEYLSSLG